jgi:hypothetical protein
MTFGTILVMWPIENGCIILSSLRALFAEAAIFQKKM